MLFVETPFYEPQTRSHIPQGVFTYLIENLGVKNVQFEELVSLDSSTLQQINALGVIFLFKYPTGEKPTDVPKDGTFDFEAVEKGSTGEEGGVWFAAQTIQNACGTQALLSMVLNKRAVEGVEIGGPLGEFREFTGAFPADVSLAAYTTNTYGRRILTTAATGRSALEFGPNPRRTQLVRAFVAVRQRRDPLRHRGRRRLPLYRVHQHQRHIIRA